MKRKLVPVFVLLFMLLFSVQVFASPGDTYTENGLTFKITNNNTATLTDCDESISGDVVIPDTINGYPVTEIGDFAIWNHKNLTSIKVPSSVTKIGDGFCSLCSSLESADYPTTVRLGHNAFWNCTSLESVVVPASSTRLTAICWGCTNLKSVTFMDGATGVGSCSFNDCVNLTEIVLPNTKSFEFYICFENCPKLEKVDFSKVTDSMYITSSFTGCDALTSVSFPNIATLGMIHSFTSCKALETVSVGPDTNVYINGFSTYYSFEDCPALKEFDVDERNTSVKIVDGMWIDNQNNLGAYTRAADAKEITIPEGVVSINASAFKDSANLESVTVSSTVKYINDTAFESCPKLSSVTLGEQVGSIREHAFFDCPNLTEITLPYTTSGLGKECLGYLSDGKVDGFTIYGVAGRPPETYAKNNGFTFVPVSPDPSELVVPTSWLEYTVKNGSAVITGAEGDISANYTTLIIPETIDGYPVTEIAEAAFFWNAPATVIISDSVKKIGSNAFENNPGLKSITFPKNVESMGSYILSSCPDLTEVILPETLKEIPEGMFENCSALAEIEIPETVTKIGFSAFGECTALTEVSLPESVTSLGEWAFAGCTGMETLCLPAGVKEIGGCAFGYTRYGQPIEGQYLVLYPAAARLAAAREIPFALLPFSDDTETGSWKWAGDSIYTCVANGVITGYPDNTFLTDKSVSRAEFVSMLYGVYKLMNLDDTFETHPFTDAKAGWYQEALSWAYSFEIVSGTSKTTFSPNRPIARQEMAAILYRFISTFFEVSAPTGNQLSRFEDADRVSSYAKAPMEFCLENGILYGMSSTKLSPLGTATRAQAAAVIARTFFTE